MHTHETNSSFSRHVPGLQLAFDSTSLTALKTCPRKYQYEIVEGWTGRSVSVHLAFGIAVHEGKERYDRARAEGRGYDEAVEEVIERALMDTWNPELQRPVPWCLSGDPNKNRLTLIRTLVWYFEEYREDALETIVFADGKPAVELSFSFDTNFWTQGGNTHYGDKGAAKMPERFVLCGHIDRLGELNGAPHVADVKTTKHTISESFFASFTPNTQFSMYPLAARVFYSLPVRGIVVDGIQVAVTFSRFERRVLPRSDESLSDFLRDCGQWFKVAESYARAGHWPMNETSCGNYGGCPFRIVCSHPPSSSVAPGIRCKSAGTSNGILPMEDFYA